MVAVVVPAGVPLTGAGGAVAFPEALTLAVVTDLGDRVRVRLGEPVAHACTPSPTLAAVVEVEVPRDRLAPVLQRQWERIWPDSAQIWVAPGVPVSVADGVPSTDLSPFTPALPMLGGRVGTRFTPFPAPTGLTDGTLAPGVRLAFGPSLVLTLAAEVDSVELGAREGVYTPCARLVGVTRDAVGPPREAPTPRPAPAEPAPVAPDSLPAGTLLRWPDGSPAGSTRVPVARARFEAGAPRGCDPTLVPGLTLCVDPALLPPPPPPPTPTAPPPKKRR